MAFDLAFIGMNFLISFALFACIIGVMLTARNLFDNKEQFKQFSNWTYVLFFVSSFLLNIGNYLAFNLIPMWGGALTADQSFIYSLVIKGVNITATISFFLLAIALQYERPHENQRIKIIWSGLIIFGIINLFIQIITSTSVESIENGFGNVIYSNPLAVNFSSMFVITVGIWYSYQTINNYLRQYRKMYVIKIFHILFIFTSILAIVSLTISLFLRFTINPEANIRASLFVIATLSLLAFPTLRWTYIDHYKRRIIEFERNKLLDLINHDLSNITQILLSLIESTDLNDNKELDFDLLLKQVERMNKLIVESRDSVRTSPYAPMD